jgi:hypothetical protein
VHHEWIDEPLLLASYRAAVPLVEFTPEAFIEPLRVGADVPDMPAWLDPDLYVSVPLEPTYRAAWEVCPSDFRHLVEYGDHGTSFCVEPQRPRSRSLSMLKVSPRSSRCGHDLHRAT